MAVSKEVQAICDAMGPRVQAVIDAAIAAERESHQADLAEAAGDHADDCALLTATLDKVAPAIAPADTVQP